MKKNLPIRVPGHRALARVHFETCIYIIFEHVFIKKKLPLRVVFLTGTQNRKMFFWLILSNIFIEKKVHAQVADQRRLAFKSASRSHRPDLHRPVFAAAGQLAILAPCNRRHPVIVRSQQTNQQKQREKKTCKKNRTSSSGRSGSTGNLQIASPKS